jgi:hypothetical protein
LCIMANQIFLSPYWVRRYEQHKPLASIDSHFVVMRLAWKNEKEFGGQSTRGTGSNTRSVE